MRALLYPVPAAAALALLLLACRGEQGVTPGLTPSPQAGPTETSSGPQAPFETIEMGDQSAIGGGQPQLFAIRRESEWEQFWPRLQANLTPTPELPAVDFSREIVIAAVDRTEPSGGYRFEITAIEEAGGALEVHVSKGVPGQDCAVTAVITQPYHIVRLARSDLPPRLVLSEETYSCG